MDIPTKIPLLRLPLLVIEEVLSTMIPFELINLSKTSPACRFIVKSLSKNMLKSYKIHVSSRENPTIRFHGNNIYYGWEITDDIEKEGTRYSEEMFNAQYDTVCVYSNGENLMKKCIEVFMDINRVLNVGIDYFYIHLFLLNEQRQTVLDWLNTNFQSIPSLHVVSTNVSVADLEHTLNSLAIAKSVHICGQTLEKCAFNIPENFERVVINHGSWIKLDHLMSFKASIIQIRRAELTNVDLNLFFTSFINMECLQNLILMEVNILDIDDIASVLQDIPHRDEQPERFKWRLFDNNRPVQLNFFQ